MKNILMLTTLYPADDVKFLNNTAVCHFFAKEWANMGYSVRVVFFYNLFPFYYYPLLRLLNKTIANKSGISVLDKYLPSEHSYTMDGVKITRIPIKKSRPGGLHKQDSIGKAAERIKEILQSEGFAPDLIVSHFLHPSLEVINILKKTYNVPTAISLHGKERVYSEDTAKKLEAIDYVGYRCHPIGCCFEKLYGKKPNFFCFSGVPQEYIVDSAHDFTNGVHNFIYVGSLIDRKHPSCLVPAISNVMKNDNFSIIYVGDGAQKSVIEKLAEQNGCKDKLVFTGRINREGVTKELDKADVFIMLSTDETFGLVYLEAMARGCIVIASKDEGMDGIIEHGVNGFLCKDGDADELAKVLAEIKVMTPEQLKSISVAGLETARRMTDKKMAKEYITSLMK